MNAKDKQLLRIEMMLDAIGQDQYGVTSWKQRLEDIEEYIDEFGDDPDVMERHRVAGFNSPKED